MSRPVPRRERGAALLAVLLLVAITGAIAAAAMERLRLSRAIAENATALDQARAFADGVEQLAVLTLDDRIAESPDKTIDTGWNGAVRRVTLPGGGSAEARVRDGGNCFNLNSVVEGDPRTALVRRPSGVAQFTGLMMALEVPESEARRIAEAAADWIDTDTDAGPVAAEDSAYAAGDAPYRTGNTLFADPGELRAIAGVSPALYRRLGPWLCTLPVSDLSPLNINTLSSAQAPLLAMLAPGQLSPERARQVLGNRPSAGWGSQSEFWRTEALNGLNLPLDVQLQPQLKTVWYTLDVTVRVGEARFDDHLLIDARLQPSRAVARRWGS